MVWMAAILKSIRCDMCVTCFDKIWYRQYALALPVQLATNNLKFTMVDRCHLEN